MEIYSVSVPENKATFFLEFLELLGRSIEKKVKILLKLMKSRKKN